MSHVSYIRKGKCRPATTPMSRSGYPSWILKWAGLESSGQRLISSIGKTKKKAFFQLTLFFLFFKILRFFEQEKDWAGLESSGRIT